MKTTQRLLLTVIMTTLGIYSYAQNVLPTSGNVGIGTASPSTELQVEGTSTLSKTVVRDSATFNAYVNIKDSVRIDKKLTVDQDLRIKGKTIVDDNFRAKSNVVVLGTTRMKGNAVSEGNFRFLGLADSTLNDERFLMIKPNGKVESMEKTVLTTLVEDEAYGKECKFTDVNMPITSFWKATPNINYGILSTGSQCPSRVGIGTDNPQFTLDVVGNAHISQSLKVGNNSIFIASVDQGTGSNNNIYATGDLLLQSDASNSFNTIINANNNGYVGIGITNPGHKLEVAGTVRACKFIAEANSWCDYVFEEDYELMSIEDLEKFIKVNKHLPDVPSEFDVLGKEIDVVEIETILLKKIEELTLYVIQQQKEIEKLKEKKLINE